MPELTNLAMPTLPPDYSYKPSPLLQSCTDFVYGVSHCKDIVVTCEDKDNNVCWAQLGPHMVCRWYYMLTSSSRWAFANMTTFEVVRLYREEFDDCLPKFLLTGNTKMHDETYPPCMQPLNTNVFVKPKECLHCVVNGFLPYPQKLATKKNTAVSEMWYPSEISQAGSNFVRSRVA